MHFLPGKWRDEWYRVRLFLIIVPPRLFLNVMSTGGQWTLRRCPRNHMFFLINEQIMIQTDSKSAGHNLKKDSRSTFKKPTLSLHGVYTDCYQRTCVLFPADCDWPSTLVEKWVRIRVNLCPWKLYIGTISLLYLLPLPHDEDGKRED